MAVHKSTDMKSTRSAAFFISHRIKVTVNNIITNAKKSHTLLGHEMKLTTTNDMIHTLGVGTHQAIAISMGRLLHCSL